MSREDNGLPEKKCSKCDVVKQLDEFHREKNSKDGRQSYCKECRKEYSKQYRQDNKEEINEYNKQYREDNKEQLKQYDQDHKEERNERDRNRYHNDPAYALMKNVSRQVRAMLKRTGGSKNGESVEKYLPYTDEELWNHLRSGYTEGMNDNNYGEWEIDHKNPQSLLLFDSMDHPNFLKCWALENLQPLWAADNISKSNKII